MASTNRQPGVNWSGMWRFAATLLPLARRHERREETDLSGAGVPG